MHINVVFYYGLRIARRIAISTDKKMRKTIRLFFILFLSAAASAHAQNDSDLQGPFFLVDESPLQVVKILESLSGQTAIISSELPNVKINFSTPKKISRQEAVMAFKSLLAINGVAITPLGEKFFKAAPSKGVTSQAPTFISGRASDLPASQNFYSKFYSLSYIEVESLKDAIKPFISPNDIATFTPFPRSNAFMLTDTLANQQRVENLIDKLDRPTTIREDVAFIQLKNMSAEDMKRRLTSMQTELLKKYFDKTTIESDERTNQLIVITEHSNMPTIKDFVAKLDIDAESMTRSEVFYIKHGEAKDVASVLNEIVKGQQSAVKSTKTANAASATAQNRNNAASNARTRANTATTGTTAKTLPTNISADNPGASLQFSEFVTIVSDERSNSIVAYGTQPDLKQLGEIISKIDVVLPQVKIDVIVTEVTLSDNQVSGLSTFGLTYSKTDGGWSGSTSTMQLSDSDPAAFTISASETGFDAVFNVAERNNKVRVLSAPTVVTTHNKKAIVNVSQTQPLLTGVTSYDDSSTPTTKSTVEWKDIGIVLEVTPRIGDNGMVQMEIKQTVETVVGSVIISDNSQPIIGKRQAESYVSSRTGETIILGGLQQINDKNYDGKVWALSDIPLLGSLFDPSRVNKERTELIIFIRPTIIKSSSENEGLAKQQIDVSGAKAEVNRYFKTGKFQDVTNDDMGLGSFKQSPLEKSLFPATDPRIAERRAAEASAAAAAKAASPAPAAAAQAPAKTKRITGSSR